MTKPTPGKNEIDALALSFLVEGLAIAQRANDTKQIKHLTKMRDELLSEMKKSTT